MLCARKLRTQSLVTTKLSINEEGFVLEAELVPWDTKVFDFPVAQINRLSGTHLHQASAAFETLRIWVNTNHVKMVSCRLQHDRLAESFLLEQKGFRFIEMVLHPTLENLQEIRLSENGLRVRDVRESEVELIQAMAERCFVHERFHVDPRLSTELANLRYGKWVRNSTRSSSQRLLKIESNNEIVAFFIVEDQKDDGTYWHLTAVAPQFQGRGYGRKAWLAMLAYHQVNGINKVSTTISARNVRVLNLYSQLQFRFTLPEMTFHWIIE